MLLELTKKDRFNSLPYYYLAVVAKKLKDENNVKKYLAKAKSLPEYYSYVNDFRRKMFLVTSENLNAYLDGQIRWSHLAYPSFRGFKEFPKDDEKLLEDLGLKMTKLAEEVDGKYIDILWTPVEHHMGLYFLKKVRSKELGSKFDYKEYRDRQDNPLAFELNMKRNSIDECRRVIKEAVQKSREEILQL